MPCFWLYETSGVLRPAVKAYLDGEELTSRQIAALRAYFRQWIAGNWAATPGINILRRRIDGLIDRAAIREWLDLADEEGVDPL